MRGSVLDYGLKERRGGFPIADEQDLVWEAEECATISLRITADTPVCPALVCVLI